MNVDIIKQLQEIALDIVRIQPHKSYIENAESIMKIITQLKNYEK